MLVLTSRFCGQDMERKQRRKGGRSKEEDKKGEVGSSDPGGVCLHLIIGLCPR